MDEAVDSYSALLASVDKTLRVARSFLEDERSSSGIADTYAYFTNHPVAPLNVQRLRRIAVRVYKEACSTEQQPRILDLACGGGLVTTAICSALGETMARPPSVLGIDANKDEIVLAERFAHQVGCSCKFLNLEIGSETNWRSEAEETLGGRPSVVLMAYALHHLPEVEAVMRDLADWLDNGSLVLVNEENPHSPMFRLKHAVRSVIQRDTANEAHRSMAGWRRMLEESGFGVWNLEGMDLLPWLGAVAPSLCWSILFDARRLEVR